MLIEIFDVAHIKKSAGVYRFNMRVMSADGRPLMSVHGFRYDRNGQDILAPNGFRFTSVATVTHPRLRESVMSGLDELIDRATGSDGDEIMRAARIPVYTDVKDLKES